MTRALQNGPRKPLHRLRWHEEGAILLEPRRTDTRRLEMIQFSQMTLLEDMRGKGNEHERSINCLRGLADALDEVMIGV